jgi:hypothetical protein
MHSACLFHARAATRTVQHRRKQANAPQHSAARCSASAGDADRISTASGRSPSGRRSRSLDAHNTVHTGYVGTELASHGGAVRCTGCGCVAVGAL